MDQLKPGDKIVFPQATARWNRDRVYEVENVFDTGDLVVSSENGGGDIFYYSVSAKEAKEMGMTRAS